MRRQTLSIAMIAAVAGLAGGSAVARPACLYQDANLRGGPGSSYYLIGTIPAPAPVVLVRLGIKWSLISYDGETGYVATAHLSPGKGVPNDPPPSAPSLAPEQALTREIDPLFGDASLHGRFGRRGGVGFGDYNTGFRRAPWTDRTATPPPPQPFPDGACALPAAKGRPGTRKQE